MKAAPIPISLMRPSRKLFTPNSTPANILGIMRNSLGVSSKKLNKVVLSLKLSPSSTSKYPVSKWETLGAFTLEKKST